MRVRTSEAVRVRLVARARGRRIGSRTTSITRQGVRRVRIRLNATGRRYTRRYRRLRVSVAARSVDRAGNRSRRAVARRTLRY